MTANKNKFLLFLRAMMIFMLLAAGSTGTVSAAAGAPVSFDPAVSYPVGSEPSSVAIADLNGDGRLDLVVANQNSDSVSVMLGTGSGSFGPATNFTLDTFQGTAQYPGRPLTVTVGDLNGDGKLDLVTADNFSGYLVTVLFGNGDGTFQEPALRITKPLSQPFVYQTALDVAIGDLNGDGKQDLVTVNYGTDSLSVILGTGSGSFGAITDFAVGTNPKWVAIGDLNGDGKPDLVAANGYDNTISVLLGNGDGTFGTATNLAVGNTPVSLAIGDFNGDGKPDLVVANQIDNNVSVLPGNGDGTFGTATNFTVGVKPSSVVIGDLNGDGNLDLTTTNLGDSINPGSVSVLLGNGDGSFGAATPFAVGVFPLSVAIGDLNGVGKPDLVTANRTLAGTISVLLARICAAGKYDNGSGCVSADPGYYVPAPGAASEIPCALGAYQPGSGATSCIPAPAGSFVNAVAAISAAPCEVGTYQPGSGASSCIQAPAGSFVNTIGAAAATLCPAGYYQPSSGATACIAAPVGKYVSTPGATSATDCALGFYQPNTGSFSCIAASAGHYVDMTGSAAQSDCLPGYYQPNAGQTNCLAADAGYYVPAAAATAQIQCPSGYTSAAGAVHTRPGATACTPIDNLAPTASPIQSPAANGAGWNNTDVTVAWNWADNTGGSGIDNANCTTSTVSSGEGNITLNATCKDLAGNIGSASTIVQVDKTNPTITASATKADTTAYTAGTWTNQSVTVHFTCSDTAGSGVAAGACPADAVFSSDGVTASVNGTATDNAGNSASTSFGPIKIDKTAPVTSAGGAYTGFKGAAIVLNNASAVDALNPGSVTVTWSINSALCSFSNVNAVNPTLTCSDSGSFTATLTASDGLNPAVSSNAIVTVNNIAPTLGAIAITNPLAPVNTAVNASATFTDPGSLDTHTASWNWDDGSPISAGTIVESNGNGTARASHSYTLPGVYVPKLTVTNKNGAASNQATYEFVVIYDPSAGFVTGSSTIKVLGSYLANPTSTYSGKLGFNTKYKKDGTLESETEFELTGVKFHFHSYNAAWMVVNGYKAEYQGTGSVEGSSHLYGFTVSVIDGQAAGGGGIDKIRLSIWDITNGNAFVYDTQPGAPVNADPTNPIVNGNLMIRK